MHTTSVSRLNDVFDTRPRPFLLSTIFKEMQQGNASLANLAEASQYRTLAAVTERARELRFQRGNKAAYDLLKQGMPQFIPAAVLKNRSEVETFSHFVCLEWDGDVDTAHAFVIGTQHPNVFAIWRSLSGNPKFLIPIEPVSSDGDTLTSKNFKHAWYAAACMFEEIGDADPTAMNPVQPQALCYDPDLFLNPDAVPIDWDVDDLAFEMAFPNVVPPESVAYAELPVEYHVAIQEMEWAENGIGKTRVPCPWGSHENDGWNARDNATRIRRNGDNDFTFTCYKCPQPSRSRRYCERPTKTREIKDSDPITLPHDHPLLVNAPPVEVREQPSFRHFSEEERMVARQVLHTSPDAGWNGETPIWTPKYKYLHPLTHKFALNGQPSEVEKRRVWSTEFGECPHCGGLTAKWLDRYELTAGYYCDGCHKDYRLGSYLEIELDRKLTNSVTSEYEGFLGDNTDFVDFRLFEPGTLTHLGAGMGTGKTTEILRNLVSLAQQGLGKGIIAVPRIALAQQLAYQLRWRDGFAAWGLYTEGSSQENKFIGEYGAIVCLPSLPQAVHEAEAAGVNALYFAIDELDFGYDLLALDVTRSTAIKKILRDALRETGLVVSGQTESTLALEAFAQEIECEQVQGFYNTAEIAEGFATLKKHPVDTDINAFLARGIDDISNQLADGHNVYAFCASRRDGEILADTFATENPLVYNAYTKGDARAHDLLRYQRLTDSKLFIGTSAAGVGISFLDRKAVTVILSGLTFGSRHANMTVQKSTRDRGRRGVSIHYKDYNFALPVRPSENRDVSLYHELLKQREIPTHAVTKIAAAQALASLADVQFEAFVRYHLGTVGNMEVITDTPTTVPQDVAEAIGAQRAEIRLIETELKKENAKTILFSVLQEDTDTQLLTASEIRRYRNQGRLSTEGALANELANEAARAVGWDDVVDRFADGDPFQGVFETADIDVALSLVDRNFDLEQLTRKRAGYLAVNAPKWTANRFELEVQSANPQLTVDGLGVEVTAIKDYRLLGELLSLFLDVLVGAVFEEAKLAEKVTTLLKSSATTGKTFGQELRSGALGAGEYRKARFLHCAEAETIVKWLGRFVSEWYPARLSKRENFYALQPDTHASLYLQAFERWLTHQPDVFDTADIRLEIFSPIEMPESNAEKREIARKRRQEGATLEVIAEELGVRHQTIRRWCEDVGSPKTEALRKEAIRLSTEENLSQRQIAKILGIKTHTTVGRWLKKAGGA